MKRMLSEKKRDMGWVDTGNSVFRLLYRMRAEMGVRVGNRWNRKQDEMEMRGDGSKYGR